MFGTLKAHNIGPILTVWLSLRSNTQCRVRSHFICICNTRDCTEHVWTLPLYVQSTQYPRSFSKGVLWSQKLAKTYEQPGDVFTSHITVCTAVLHHTYICNTGSNAGAILLHLQEQHTKTYTSHFWNAQQNKGTASESSHTKHCILREAQANLLYIHCIIKIERHQFTLLLDLYQIFNQYENHH